MAFLVLIPGAVACQSTPDDDASDDALTSSNAEVSLYRPGNRFSGWGGEHDRYLDEVQPLLGKRCVTCHGCSQSPCQLKLTGYEGVVRGATKVNLFEQKPLAIATGPTRMKDGVTEADWRKKGFFSVTAGGKDSIMHRLLEHGTQFNKDGFDLSGAQSLFDKHAEDLKFQCVETKPEVDERLSKPGTGMPLGFTGLSDAEYATLSKWLEDGAPGPTEEAKKILAAPRDAASVKAWEDFFNQDSPKARLSMRYLFEHLAFARLHLEQNQTGKGDYFDLVRATAATGDIHEIVTERANDDPKAPFFYRLKKHTHLQTAKDFTVFHLNDAVRARWTQLFLQSQWDIKALPGYSQNPFKDFEAIPGVIRDQFMLENSQRLVDGMVKDDVCTGSSATYAIRDRFFTLFLKPESDPSAIDPKFGQMTWMHLDPNSAELVREWDFAHLFMKNLKLLKPQGLTVSDLWDGGKTDKNAWITVFRHGKNASAHQGPMGQFPETMWVLNYANFERLFYDLVVLYEPWAALPHKLRTWSTMSNVRANGEDMFLLFLPPALRETVGKQFTPGVSGWTEISMNASDFPGGTPDLDPTHPMADFVSRARKYLGEAIVGTDVLNPDPLASLTKPDAASGEPDSVLASITKPLGNIPDEMPDLTWISVEGSGEPRVYSILVNRMYKANTRLITSAFPGLNRQPQSDTFSVVRGQLGSYPNLFLRVPAGDLAAFAKAATGAGAERLAVFYKYSVKANSSDFWKFLDESHTRALKQNALEAGIFDTAGYLFPNDLVPQPAAQR